jgi:hypothetical protein
MLTDWAELAPLTVAEKEFVINWNLQRLARLEQRR